MCGRFTLRAPASVVAEQLALFELPPFTARFNIAPTQPVAAVRFAAERDPAQRELDGHRGEGSSEVWDQIRAELNEAIDILSDADRKAAYDIALHQQANGERRLQEMPAAAIGKGGNTTIRCSQCGSTSSATRRYCSDCGHSLWEPCLECGTLNTAGGKYCGACGASVLDTIQQESQRAKDALREAESLRSACEYDRAIAVLGPISSSEHARLAEEAEQAGRLIREIAEARDQAKAAMEETFSAAREDVDRFDYRAAIDRLQCVPEPLRTAEIDRFLQDQHEQLEEVAALETGIHAAASDGNHAEIPQTVRQLLALKPDHTLAQKLATQIRDRFVKAARQKLDKHQYASAAKILEQVPGDAGTPEVSDLYDRASDLAYMLSDLRNAPHVDEPLLGFSERLCRLAPGDARGPKLRDEIRRRLAAAAKEPAHGLRPWAKPPERTHVGYPVDWLVDLQPLAIREEVSERLFSGCLGRLFVACGLALQGLGKGPVRTNLLPRDGRSIAGLVGQVFGKRPARSAWGLDLSTSGLKAVRLSVEGDGQSITITDCDLLEHSKPLNEAVNEEERRLLVTETLKAFSSRREVKADRICVGLSGRMVLVREMVVPLADRRKMTRAVEYEARRHVPFPLSDLVWDYEVLDRPDPRSGASGETHVAVVAAKHLPLKDHVARFSGAGLVVDIVQNDCLALHNFLSFRRERAGESGTPLDGQSTPATAVVDLGADATNVLVTAPDMVWFRSSGFGGQSFDKALVRELKLTMAQAEACKRDPAAADSPSKFYKAIEPILVDLVAEIHASLEVFGRTHGHRQIREIVGIGGGFRMHGLLRFLRTGS